MVLRLLKWSLFTGVILALSACQSADDNKPQKPTRKAFPSGLEYIHFVSNEDKYRAKLNDYLEIEVRILTEGQADTIADTYRYAERPLYRQAEFPEYKGAPEEALVLLHPGDSIHLFVEANKKYRVEPLPKNATVKPNTRIEYQIKVIDVLTPSQYAEIKMEEERQDIADFLAKEKQERGVTYKKHPSGIYYHIEAHGAARESLKPARSGDKITIHYIGRFLGGLGFDRTVFPKDPDKNKPISFVLGKKRVIPGWEMLLSSVLVKGDQANVIIPSRYAFGKEGQPKLKVPPFTPLRFKIKVVDIKRGQ